jgi:SAM-dependent methyltransferase
MEMEILALSCCVPGGENPDTSGAANFFDGQAELYKKRFSKKGFEKSQKKLFEALQRFGLEEKTLLEIGCGVGYFSFQVLRSGMKTTLGYDLSPKMIQTAKYYAKELALEDRSEFVLGDFAQQANSNVEAHDLVLLDKVICCYENWSRLLDKSMVACKNTLAFTIPKDSAFIRILFRFLPGLTKIFGIGFHPFFHDHNEIESFLEARRFHKVLDENVGIWNNKIFSKEL